MIYPIVVYGNTVLKKQAEPITKDYPNLTALIEDMFKTLDRAEGVGLAAPQIGLPIKLFIVDLSPLKDEKPEWASFKKVFINPEITFFSDEKESREEGCLSIPGISERVPRSLSVTIHYFDENWVEKTETYSDFEARAIQHEYDHLMGHVFIDRISPIRRQMISSKLSSISKGKARTHYKIRN